MWKKGLAALCGLVMLASHPAGAAEEPASAAPQYDPALAKSLGADDMGMRKYVLVILKSGPNKVEGEARAKMFQGHFANIKRLAAEQKLVFAGPFDDANGWRGMFVFATGDIEEAKRYVATDPVIISGEMVAEYHKLYGSAGLMMLNDIHSKIQKKGF